MPEYKKVFVSIYCKIFTDNFSEEMIDRMAAGKQIFEFMMKDAGQCFDDEGKRIPGDHNVWYLGCNEKFGHLKLENKTWRWSFGESSFDNVLAFVTELFEMGIISSELGQRHTGTLKGRLSFSISSLCS